MSFLQGYSRKLGVTEYLGVWNAATNTPTLTSSQGQRGGYYIVSQTGQTNLNGITSWEAGDWAVFNGEVWQQIDNQNQNSQSSTVALVDGGFASDSYFDSNVIIDGGEA